MQTLRSTVRAYYQAFNHMLAGRPQDYISLWESGESSSLLLSVGEQRKGWTAVEALIRRLSALMAESTLRVHADPTEVSLVSGGELAYVVTQEAVTVRSPRGEQEFGQRTTIVFRHHEGGWRVLHAHSDSIPPTQAIFSSLLFDRT